MGQISGRNSIIRSWDLLNNDKSSWFKGILGDSSAPFMRYNIQIYTAMRGSGLNHDMAQLQSPWDLTLTHKILTKSYRDYLQNTSHVVLRNCPSLSIAMERLTCLSNDPWCTAGDSRLACSMSRIWDCCPPPQMCCMCFFFSPPSLPSSFGR